MQTAVEERDYLTPAEAARQLHVSVSTIWRWIEKGKLPAYRVGERSIRIKKQDLSKVITPVKEGTLIVRFPAKGTLRVELPLDSDKGDDFLERAKRLREAILRERNGVPLPDGAEDIRAAREERDRETDSW
jgi:excisionase family DNA binding protein